MTGHCTPHRRYLKNKRLCLLRWAILLVLCPWPIASYSESLEQFPLLFGSFGNSIYQYLAGGVPHRDDANPGSLNTGVASSHGISDICVSRDMSGSYVFAVNENGTVSTFSRTGQHLDNVTTGSNDSCVADASGHIYLGSVETRKIRKFEALPSASVLQTFNPETSATEDQTALVAMDLANDQCTLLYTDHDKIRKFNICTNTQLPDLATDLPTAGNGCVGLKIRVNGDVIVSCRIAVHLISPAGSILRTYASGRYRFDPGSEPGFFGRIALARDGRSFWVTKWAQGSNPPDYLRRAYKIDIPTSGLTHDFNLPSNLAPTGAVAMYDKPSCVWIRMGRFCVGPKTGWPITGVVSSLVIIVGVHWWRRRRRRT